MTYLKRKAEKLGIDFDDAIDKDDLQKLVDAKEEEVRVAKEKEKEHENDVEHWKEEAKKFEAEAKKAYERRDIFKSDKTALSNKIKKLEDKMKGMTDKETLDALKEEFEGLKTFKSEIDKKKEKDKFDKMDEIERVRLESKKEAEKFQKQMDDLKKEFEKEKGERDKEFDIAQKKISNLRKSTLDMDIMEAAVKGKAWNPKQVVKLVRDDFTYDDDLDKYSFIKRDGKGKVEDELSIPEYVDAYLKDESNENLVKSDVNTSSLHSDKTKPGEKPIPTKSKYNPKDPDIIREADLQDVSVERHIKYLEMKDEAMAKKEEKKE